MEDNAPESILRVSAKTSVPNLAAAVSHAVYDGKRVTLRAVGHGAIGQAVKAVAVARGYVGPRGLDLSIRPGFAEIEMPNHEIVTALVLKVIVS